MRWRAMPQPVYRGGPEGVFGIGSGAPHPLAAFYGVGPGKIAIHHSTAGAVPAGGPATGLRNLGGSGPYHDAAVTGAAIPVAGNYLSFTPAGGVMSLLNSAELVDVHLMFVLDGAAIANGRKLFGSPTTEIVISASATDWRLTTRRGIGGTTVPSSGSLIPMTSGPQLCELTMSAAGTQHYLNGVLNRNDTNPVPSFPIIDLGRGSDANAQLNGLMGDVLGVTLGTGADAAIAAALAYLNTRFGRTWAR